MAIGNKTPAFSTGYTQVIPHGPIQANDNPEYVSASELFREDNATFDNPDMFWAYLTGVDTF